MRYPDPGHLKAQDRNGKHFVGSYVREAGTWRRSSFGRDGADLFYLYFEDVYEQMASAKQHPFLTRLAKKGSQ